MKKLIKNFEKTPFLLILLGVYFVVFYLSIQFDKSIGASIFPTPIVMFFISFLFPWGQDENGNGKRSFGAILVGAVFFLIIPSLFLYTLFKMS